MGILSWRLNTKGAIIGLYWGHVGIMENIKETTI